MMRFDLPERPLDSTLRQEDAQERVETRLQQFHSGLSMHRVESIQKTGRGH